MPFYTIKQKNILKTFGWYFTVHDCSIADILTSDQAIALSKTAATVYVHTNLTEIEG